MDAVSFTFSDDKLVMISSVQFNQSNVSNDLSHIISVSLYSDC